MSESESFPIFLRVLPRPKPEKDQDEATNYQANDSLRLVFDCETTTDFRQDLRFGIARVYAFGRLTRTVVFYDKVSGLERETISRYATERGFDYLSREEFVLKIFLPLALRKRAVVVGFNLPFDLSRLSVDFSPKRNVRATERWTLRFVPKTHPQFAFIPGVRIRHNNSRMSFIHFSGVRGKRGGFRGSFVDLRTLSAALTGEGHTLESAGKAFGCALKKSEAEHGAPITTGYLDYCLNDVSLTAELYEKALIRYQKFNLAEHPSRVFSSASLGKAAFRARGVNPPKVEGMILPGRIMAAYYAGKVECRVARKEVPDVAVLDFTSQYPSLYCLLGAECFLKALHIENRISTEEVRAWIESLTLEDLLRRETWANPLMWSLCEVEAKDDLLPVRSPYSSKADQPTIGWNRVTCKDGVTLPYLIPDVIAAKLLRGKVPKIVRAVTFAPVGKQDLNEIPLLGTTIGPDDNLIPVLGHPTSRLT
jgi:hypothetical protein